MTTFTYKTAWNASRVNVLFDVFQAWPIISLKSNTWAITSGFNLHTILLVCDTICIYYSVLRLFAAVFKPSWFRTNTKRRLRSHCKQQKGELFIIMFVGLGLNSTPHWISRKLRLTFVAMKSAIAKERNGIKASSMASSWRFEYVPQWLRANGTS